MKPHAHSPAKGLGAAGTWLFRFPLEFWLSGRLGRSSCGPRYGAWNPLPWGITLPAASGHAGAGRMFSPCRAWVIKTLAS